MKILKILLAVVLLLSYSSIYASTVNKEKKCKVTIIIPDVQETTIDVDSGKKNFNDILNGYTPQSPIDGKIFSGWEFDGVGIDGNNLVVGNVTVKAKWRNQADVIAEQDSLLWERYFKSKVEELLGATGSPKVDPKGELWLYLILGIAIVLSVFSLLLSILLSKRNQVQLRDNVVEIVMGSDQLQDWRDNGKASVQSTASPNTSYDSDIRDLRKRLAELEDELKNSTRDMVSTGGGTSTSSSHGTKKNPAPAQKFLYADSIVDGKFTCVKESPGEYSIFELKLKGDSHASVTIHKPAYKKVLANPSYLEGCEKQLLGSAILSIEREGEAQKNDNGKWVVTKPLKVRVS